MRVVGKICGYHGIKGEVKIYPLLDELDDFYDFEELKINDTFYKVKSCRMHKANILVVFAGIKDRTDAEEKLTGYVEADYEADLASGEFYIDDIVGMKVVDQSKRELGQVVSFSQQKQSHLVIKLLKDFEAKHELLLPFVDEYIINISKDDRTVEVKIIDDLLELCK